MTNEEWFMRRPTIRTQGQIKSSGQYTRDAYRTSPMKDMSIEKQKYQEKLIGVENKDTLQNTKPSVDYNPVELDEQQMRNMQH